MSTALDQAYENQLKNIETATGKSIAEWIAVIKASGLEKHGELVAMLKTNYGMGHGNANMLVHTAKQSHAGAEANETDWIAEQYQGKENLKAWYDVVMEKVQALGTDVELSPKKAYMSLRRKKQFAIIQPSTKTRLDIGLNIKGMAPEANLEAAGSWNAMCTHRIKVEDAAALNEQLFGWIKKAYEQAG
jgi:predicted transport protein